VRNPANPPHVRFVLATSKVSGHVRPNTTSAKETNSTALSRGFGKKTRVPIKQNPSARRRSSVRM